jgi:Omp85 superfamily domain
VTKPACLLAPALWLIASAGLAQTDSPFPRIRSIVIEHKSVFGPEERLDDIPHVPDLTFIFHLANFLHIDTKEEVIRRELLLHEGEPADPALIAESERNLRALPYIRQVRIFTLPAPDGQVDLHVLAQDTWTTQPRVSFAVGGGSQRSSLGIVEENVLGYGKKVRLLYRHGIDRDSTLFEYDDPRLLGSRWLATGAYQDTSDGHVAAGFLSYPFYSLDTPYSASAGYSERRERGKEFDHFGTETASFRHKQEFTAPRIGARLAMLSDSDVVWRAGPLYRWNDETFSDLSPSTAPPSELPADQRWSEPGMFLHRETVDYVREHHFELFDKTEDLNLGNTFDADFGYSWRELGALIDEPILNAADRQGIDFGEGRKAFLYTLVTGRYNNGDVRNAVGEVEAIDYYRFYWLCEHTLVSRVKLDLGRNLDKDVQIFLGNFNGLRGFDTRQFAGEKRFIFNLEDRVFFVNDLFHLVSLGAVFFFDSGYVWAPNQGVDFRRMATSAGIGLRVDALRGAGEALFRLDLGFPMTDGGSGTHGPGVTIGTGQAFTPFVGPFDLQSTTGGP